MKKLRRNEILFGLVLIAICLVWLGVRGLGKKKADVAILTYGDHIVERLPLDKDDDFCAESNGYKIHIQIKNHRAGFVDSTCPDHICEHYGMLGDDGDIAVCLPAKATLSIQKKS